MHMVQSRNAAVNIPKNSTAPFFFVLPQVRAVRALRKNFIIETKSQTQRRSADHKADHVLRLILSLIQI